MLQSGSWQVGRDCLTFCSMSSDDLIQFLYPEAVLTMIARMIAIMVVMVIVLATV